MGEAQRTLFSPDFNRSIQVEARPDRLSAETGALLLRELAERLGYRALLVDALADPRDPDRLTHPFAELLLTRLLMLAQGWGAQADVTRLRDDPVLRLAVSTRRGEGPLRPAAVRVPRGLPSQPTLSRFLQTLAREENRSALNGAFLSLAVRRLGWGPGRRRREVVVDLDSLPLEVHGHQPGSAYNGHYRVRCYHPLVARLEEGDYLGAQLRAGNAHTADGGLAFVLPILDEVSAWARCVWLRIDAGFPEPHLLATLEAQDHRYVARLRSNRVLARLAAPYLEQDAPEEEARTYELRYRAKSWEEERRVVLVVLARANEQGELFQDHFFLLTNASCQEMDGPSLLARYRGRGAAEKDFGDFNQAFALSLSSTPRPKAAYRGRAIEEPICLPDSFAANEARLLLALHAANLLHAARSLLARHTRRRLSREALRQLLLKVPSRVVLGGRRVTVCIASGRARLWSQLWSQIRRLPSARGSPRAQALPLPA